MAADYYYDVGLDDPGFFPHHVPACVWCSVEGEIEFLHLGIDAVGCELVMGPFAGVVELVGDAQPGDIVLIGLDGSCQGVFVNSLNNVMNERIAEDTGAKGAGRPPGVYPERLNEVYAGIGCEFSDGIAVLNQCCVPPAEQDLAHGGGGMGVLGCSEMNYAVVGKLNWPLLQKLCFQLKIPGIAGGEEPAFGYMEDGGLVRYLDPAEVGVHHEEVLPQESRQTENENIHFAPFSLHGGVILID